MRVGTGSAMRVLGAVLAVVWLAPAATFGQAPSAPRAAPAADWTPPRTPWGAPDLQGIWDTRTATPLERPAALKGREFLTDAEVAVYERRAVERADGRPPDDARTAPSVHPPYWLDYGKTVVRTKQTSLVVDPRDGKIAPLSVTGQARVDARRAARSEQGPADSHENRSLFERCMTRGLPGSMLPGPYNSNVHILQTPGQVVIFNEMIHDARIVPLDGRPHLTDDVAQWRGDSRGWWDGDTLVVETTNFSAQSSFRGSNENLHLVERFRRTDLDAILYSFTVTDPTTWTRSWTVSFPMTMTEGPTYEYACHEGNYGLRNILWNARFEETEADAEAAANPSR